MFEIFLNVGDVHCESSHQLESLDRVADNSTDVIQVSPLCLIVQQRCLEIMNIPAGKK